MKNLIMFLGATLLATSAYANNGYQEPIYLNYGVKISHEGTTLPMGKTSKNGVFTPGYLNYQFDPTVTDLDTLLRTAPPAAGTVKKAQSVAGYVEPIYLNYNN
ncbi:hypothetical protein [Corallincola holothuriorum]|nr:hypothetical protein [Corallincola holothuriorum]